MIDITNSSKTFDFFIYADDTYLILSIERELYNEAMKKELHNVVDWFMELSELYENRWIHTTYMIFTKSYIREENIEMPDGTMK